LSKKNAAKNHPRSPLPTRKISTARKFHAKKPQENAGRINLTVYKHGARYAAGGPVVHIEESPQNAKFIACIMQFYGRSGVVYRCKHECFIPQFNRVDKSLQSVVQSFSRGPKVLNSPTLCTPARGVSLRMRSSYLSLCFEVNWKFVSHVYTRVHAVICNIKTHNHT
jgi:hypothetical protein